jgi:hypothetical protein
MEIARDKIHTSRKTPTHATPADHQEERKRVASDMHEADARRRDVRHSIAISSLA